MIDSKELRVGNWVIAPGYDEIEGNFFPDPEGDFYHRIKGEDIVRAEKHIGMIGGFEPIVLTPSLLEQCGFKYSASFGKCRYEKDELQMDENFNPLAQEGDEHLYFGRRLQYLHQLQNLFFDLTGKELEVNL